jgi:hypothetical protein
MSNENVNERPPRKFNEVYEIKKRKEFSAREVGITHPDNSAFFRISDSGEIEIFAAPGIGMVINPKTRSVSIFADSIKFFCRDDDGLRWNSMSFNPAADVYNEPALVKTNEFLNNPAYFRTNHYLNNLDNLEDSESSDPVTIIGNYGLRGDALKIPVQEDADSILGFEQERLIQEFSKAHTEQQTLKLRELMEAGYSYSEALKKLDNPSSDSSNLENFPWLTNDID